MVFARREHETEDEMESRGAVFKAGWEGHSEGSRGIYRVVTDYIEPMNNVTLSNDQKAALPRSLETRLVKILAEDSRLRFGELYTKTPQHPRFGVGEVSLFAYTDEAKKLGQYRVARVQMFFEEGERGRLGIELETPQEGLENGIQTALRGMNENLAWYNSGVKEDPVGLRATMPEKARSYVWILREKLGELENMLFDFNSKEFEAFLEAKGNIPTVKTLERG